MIPAGDPPARSRVRVSMKRMRRTGWMERLRRMSGVGLLAVVVVFVVGLVRAEALALAAGDDLCVFMGGTAAPRPLPTDPTDLADHAHDCCDLGLCRLDSTALPPDGSLPVQAPRRSRPRKAPLRAAVPPGRPRRAGFRPRDPPAH